MIRIAGPKADRSVSKGLDPVCIGVALMSTPRLINSVSRPGSTNKGRIVGPVLDAASFGGRLVFGRRRRPLDSSFELPFYRLSLRVDRFYIVLGSLPLKTV